MRAGLARWTLALLAVALVVPAISQAYRAATPAERSEMERSAVRYHENPNSDVPGTNVTVTNVKVSTAGPWALASVAVTAKATGEQAGGPEAFRKIDGTWTDVGFFNEEPASMLPDAVAKDLGVPYLPSNERGTSTSTSGNTSESSLKVFFKIEALVSWFIGLLAMLSAWLTRPSHFKSIGRSKLAWMGITALGLIPIVGFIPALIYFWRVYLHLPAKHPEGQTRSRPKPVPRAPSRTAGSRNPTGGNPRPRQPPPQQPPKRQKCTSCNGGTVTCTSCDSGYVYGSRSERHSACGGTGKLKCQMCNGTGYR